MLWCGKNVSRNIYFFAQQKDMEISATMKSLPSTERRNHHVHRELYHIPHQLAKPLQGGLFQNLREQGRHGILKTAPAIRGGGRETGHKGIPDAPSDNGAMEKRADLRNRERTEQRVHGRMQYDHQDVETGMLRVQEF